MLARIARQAEPFLFSVARTYSAAAAPTQSAAPPAVAPALPDPPAKLFGTSASIASYVWQLAAKEKVLDKVQDELWQVVDVFSSNQQLRRLATDPFIPASAKSALMQRLLNDSSATAITKKLFVSLAEENALAATLQVAEAYEELMLAHKKEVYCTVITAQPLDKLEKQELRKRAEKFVEPGFQLVMKEQIDRKLIGGFILEFEDRRVDMSVAKKLDEFNNLVFKLETDLH